MFKFCQDYPEIIKADHGERLKQIAQHAAMHLRAAINQELRTELEEYGSRLERMRINIIDVVNDAKKPWWHVWCWKHNMLLSEWSFIALLSLKPFRASYKEQEILDAILNILGVSLCNTWEVLMKNYTVDTNTHDNKTRTCLILESKKK